MASGSRSYKFSAEVQLEKPTAYIAYKICHVVGHSSHGKTRLEKFFGKTSDLNYLKVFDCKAFSSVEE